MWKSKKEGAVDSLAHRITVLGGGLLLLTLFAICAVMTVLRLILMHAEGASRRAPHERGIGEQETQKGGDEAALHKE